MARESCNKKKPAFSSVKIAPWKILEWGTGYLQFIPHYSLLATFTFPSPKAKIRQ
jgi:hypothetical protein